MVKVLIEHLRAIIFGVTEVFCLLMTIGFLFNGEINYSIASGVLGIFFVLLDISNKLYELKGSANNK